MLVIIIEERQICTDGVRGPFVQLRMFNICAGVLKFYFKQTSRKKKIFVFEMAPDLYIVFKFLKK